MAHVLLIVALACALAVAAWFAVRCLLLKRSLRRADAELREIVERLEENRIVKLPSPDADLEALLGTVNASLAGIRRQAALYARREADLKAQVERISHDLRTPLTSIQGYPRLSSTRARWTLRLAPRSPRSGARRTPCSGSSRSSTTCRGSKPRTSTWSWGRWTWAGSCASRWRNSIGCSRSGGLDVRVEVPRHAVKARANAEALERVFENLLHNVSKYARSSFEAVVEEKNAEVAVVFANDVDDVGRLDAERLFEPHYAADASRSQESSGLGLTIARHLTERMGGGTLEARAEERDGVAWLSFALRLPQVEARHLASRMRGSRRAAGLSAERGKSGSSAGGFFEILGKRSKIGKKSPLSLACGRDKKNAGAVDVGLRGALCLHPAPAPLLLSFLSARECGCSIAMRIAMGGASWKIRLNLNCPCWAKA